MLDTGDDAARDPGKTYDEPGGGFRVHAPRGCSRHASRGVCQVRETTSGVRAGAPTAVHEASPPGCRRQSGSAG
jgi:hypothetical protein